MIYRVFLLYSSVLTKSRLSINPIFKVTFVENEINKNNF